MQVLAGLCGVVAALLHGPVVARLAVGLQTVADDANVGLGERRWGGERVRKSAPGGFSLVHVGGLAGPVWDVGMEVATLFGSEAAVVFDRPVPRGSAKGL